MIEPNASDESNAERGRLCAHGIYRRPLNPADRRFRGPASAAELIDVRTVPRSRHNPQFNRETLPHTLSAAGIGYRHMAALGGLRRAARHSLNGGWRLASFRGFADYMQTPEFQDAVSQLIERAKTQRVAIMCAEAVPWRCHRSLIADALVIRGVRVEDIMTMDRQQPHRLTPFARVDGLRITYPGETQLTMDDVGTADRNQRRKRKV
ncbi:MAG TPA: DUF488 domain-containing protein [Opitutaceae bacterium]|nr:DUF488 domain-containing protein [Opitutaceae bacterium]